MTGVMPESVTPMPLTVTESTPISAPSAAVTSNCPTAGAPAAVASRSSSNTMTSVVPAAGTLADSGSGPAMSGVVAPSTFEGRPVPSSLTANTR